ncbi:MAG: hypothetical protein ACI8RZ_002523 [Myxococcota bacterium]
MPLNEDQKKKVRPTHADASGALRKIIASRGDRQGNFYMVSGNTAMGLVITLSHKDRKGGQAKSQGRGLRTLLKKVEATKFAQGVVALDAKNKLVFTVLAGNASPSLIKKVFKKTDAWKDLGFERPDQLKRARVELKQVAPDGTETVKAAEPDDDETAFSDEEIQTAGRMQFGDLPDFEALWLGASKIETANRAVLEAMSELDDEDEDEKVFDALERTLLEDGVSPRKLAGLLKGTWPDLEFSREQATALAVRAKAACESGPEELDLAALRHWLAQFHTADVEKETLSAAWDKRSETIASLKADDDYTPSTDDQAQVLTLHFVRRRRSRAILEGLKVADALGRSIFPNSIEAAGVTRTGREWKQILMTADAETFVDDPDRMWDPKSLADAEKEVLSFPEDAPLTGDDWQEAGDGEFRTRCPFVNLSANHGWIPRSGWVTYTQLRRVLVDRGALTGDVADVLAKVLFDKAKVTGPDGTEMVSLADFRHIGAFHPGGLGHKDEDAAASDEELVELFAEISEDGEYLTEEDVRVSMKARHEESDLTLGNLPFAFGEAFFVFNLLAKEVDGYDEPVIHVDDLRTFLGKNQYPVSLKEKTTEEKSDLVETVLSIVDVAVDTYLPVFSSRVNDRVERVLAERSVRAFMKGRVEEEAATTADEISTVLASTKYYKALDDSEERAEGLRLITSHLARVGVLKPVTGGWMSGDKLHPVDSVEQPQG